MSSPRTILHADMDAFYAAVEQRDHPEYRGRPLIVGGIGKRGVVSTASYEARRFGVHSAQPGAIAQQLCPGGIFVQPRMSAYVEASRQIRAIFERFTPQIEPLSLDEAFLDVTGSRLLFGDGREIARTIRERVFEETELTISIGVASSKYVAKVASDLEKPNALVVVEPGTERAFLRPLSVSRLWGAGKRMQELLDGHGIRTIGDVQDIGRATLEALIGAHAGQHFWSLAHGEDVRDVVADRDAKSISHETTFEDDLDDPEAARAVLLSLAEGVGRRLRAHGLVATTVRLKLRYPPFETLTRQQRLDVPSDDDRVLHRVGVQLLDAVDRGSGIRLIGIGASGLRPASGVARQGSLFREGPDPRKAGAALRAMDAINERFGSDSITHAGTKLTRSEDGAERSRRRPH
ncbi:MAG: DNA polymerase IV [Planctomycetes bacterium]|nr:DNA polymerase IV [Planctomycetota bacterium]